jgi:hypothetical protein
MPYGRADTFRERVFFCDPPISYQPFRDHDSDIQSFMQVGNTEVSGKELKTALAQAQLLKAAGVDDGLAAATAAKAGGLSNEFAALLTRLIGARRA